MSAAEDSDSSSSSWILVNEEKSNVDSCEWNHESRIEAIESDCDDSDGISVITEPDQERKKSDEEERGEQSDVSSSEKEEELPDNVGVNSIQSEIKSFVLFGMVIAFVGVSISYLELGSDFDFYINSEGNLDVRMQNECNGMDCSESYYFSVFDSKSKGKVEWILTIPEQYRKNEEKRYKFISDITKCMGFSGNENETEQQEHKVDKERWTENFKKKRVLSPQTLNEANKNKEAFKRNSIEDTDERWERMRVSTKSTNEDVINFLKRTYPEVYAHYLNINSPKNKQKKLEKTLHKCQQTLKKQNSLLQKIKQHLKHQKKPTSKQNGTGSLDWFTVRHHAREKHRRTEQVSDWVFERAKMRSKSRNKAYWYFDRMDERHHLRQKEHKHRL